MNEAASAAHPSERSPHGRLAETYRLGLGQVTGRAIAPLLNAVRANQGTRLLDVACGSGELVGEAVSRGATAVGVDLAPGMVSVASRLFPGGAFKVGSADALPFEVASFDAVTCSFGVGQFTDAEDFARECARVLKPGGRAAVTWWQGYDKNRINGLFYDVLVMLGVTEPPPDKYGKAERLLALLESAGCGDGAVQDVQFTHRVADADAYWALAMGSFGRIAKLYEAQDPSMKARIREDVEAALDAHATADGIELPIAYRIASGVRRA